MTKKEIQKMTIKDGKPLASSKFSWDASTKTFSTAESGVTIDLRKCGDGCTVKCGSRCTVNCASNCTIDCASNCNIYCGYGCNINCGYRCTIRCGSDCTIKCGERCTIKCGERCTVNCASNCTIDCGFGGTILCGSRCTVKCGSRCNINCGYRCTIRCGSDCTIRCGSDCTIKCGERCTVKCGSRCTIESGSDCTIKCGEHCIINCDWHCTIKCGSRCVVVRRDVYAVRKLSNRTITTAPYCVPGYVENGVYSETGKPAIIADDILSEVLSERTKGDLVIRKVINHTKSEQSYLVERGGVYSHGRTLTQAIEDLRYKVADRDKSAYVEHTLETELTLDEAIAMYRVITGACVAGTKAFVESLDDVPERLTVGEMIEMTKGQYGNDALREFVSDS